GGRVPALLARGAPDIAFKTGTSYGFRDAWAAGIAGRYTIVVWTGRADGAPRDGMTGREAALPLLFRIADGISQVEPGSAMTGTPDPALPDALPETLTAFQQDPAPHILFPPDGAEIWSDRAGRGFILSAQAAGPLRWYADGQRVPQNALGEALWTPTGPGFYSVSAIDETGREARASVRVRGSAVRAE
ncbi:MAG: penicillin-binding protein 1C, partial [Maricaulis maris]